MILVSLPLFFSVSAVRYLFHCNTLPLVFSSLAPAIRAARIKAMSRSLIEIPCLDGYGSTAHSEAGHTKKGLGVGLVVPGTASSGLPVGQTTASTTILGLCELASQDTDASRLADFLRPVRGIAAPTSARSTSAMPGAGGLDAIPLDPTTSTGIVDTNFGLHHQKQPNLATGNRAWKVEFEAWLVDAVTGGIGLAGGGVPAGQFVQVMACSPFLNPQIKRWIQGS
ncbi:unnamed protein product [Protopolystoma xenopodis]|uniref:Uncharacterized protein n=1 Tax=Protopolystoma xenopodis TaxID=117903 RepID=A0A448XFF8_9PLAT|nr:unnamed protein product [Protopolystoma xenopodis]